MRQFIFKTSFQSVLKKGRKKKRGTNTCWTGSKSSIGAILRDRSLHRMLRGKIGEGVTFYAEGFATSVRQREFFSNTRSWHPMEESTGSEEGDATKRKVGRHLAANFRRGTGYRDVRRKSLEGRKNFSQNKSDSALAESDQKKEK